MSRNRACAIAGFLVLAVAGCNGGESNSTRTETRTPTKRAGSAVAPEERPPVSSDRVDIPFNVGDTRTVDGLRVIREQSGRVSVNGNDRWGRALEVTYETDEYFRNAVPTLSRSLTDEQGRKLAELVQHMTPGAPTKVRPPAPAAAAPPAAPEAEGAAPATH